MRFVRIVRSYVAPALLIVMAASCARRQPEVRVASSYTDSKLCAGCHAAHSESFHRTGMGRAFYRAIPANMVEDFAHGAFYHKASDRYYQVIRRGDRYFERRYQKGADGAETNVVEAAIDYVMGSGNHVRTYLHRTAQNRLLQLPVSWYADAAHPEKPGYFAMSPGYDRADHLDFRRKIGYDCFFCHNAYPELPAGRDSAEADPVYPAQLPEGIDCQRCHGPGSAHVEAAQRQRSAAEISRAILNPARLAVDRQLEVCMQCHLETTSFALPPSIQRYGRGTFSYRPGESLADFMLHFDHAPGTGHDDKFEIVNAAYRLRQSACFRNSGGALVCTTCHNPHRAARGEQAVAQYTAACQKCHESKLRVLVSSGRHPARANCIACHMAKRRTEDVVHAVMTDHRILRVQPGRDLLSPLAERHDMEGVSYRGEVVLYYPPSLPASPERDLYLAIAQVAQKSNLETGIPQLEAALRKYQPARPEFYLGMAQALAAAGRYDPAIAMYQTAVDHDARSALALRGLGAALAKAGQVSRGVTVLEQARALDPQDAATMHELGLDYHELGRGREALSALRDAIRLDPDLPEIRNSLGNMQLEMGERDQAEESFREAIRSQPDLAQAHHGYGAALASRNRFVEAQKELEMAVKLSPDFPEAQAMLGDLYARVNKWPQAIRRYREALRARPQFGPAHLGLGTALAATGDFADARQHLTQAAQDSNPEMRQEAERLLGQLPR